METSKFITIEQVREIKSIYAIKACDENGKNKRTNNILWYASHILILYDRLGITSKIEKDIKQFRKTVGELTLILEREA